MLFVDATQARTREVTLQLKNLKAGRYYIYARTKYGIKVPLKQRDVNFRLFLEPGMRADPDDLKMRLVDENVPGFPLLRIF